MHPEFVNSFIRATINVFSTMARLTPRPGKPALKKGNIADGDVTGVLGLMGHAEGSLAVSLSASCALKAVENMLGERHEEVNDEVADAVGELTNMISGDARARLERIGYAFTAGIPTVLRGKGRPVKHVARGGPILLIPFTTEEGNFYVEACFAE